MRFSGDTFCPRAAETVLGMNFPAIGLPESTSRGCWPGTPLFFSAPDRAPANRHSAVDENAFPCEWNICLLKRFDIRGLPPTHYPTPLTPISTGVAGVGQTASLERPRWVPCWRWPAVLYPRNVRIFTGAWTNAGAPGIGGATRAAPQAPPPLKPEAKARIDAYQKLVAKSGDTPGGCMSWAQGMPGSICWALAAIPMEIIQHPEQITICGAALRNAPSVPGQPQCSRGPRAPAATAIRAGTGKQHARCRDRQRG